MYPQTQSQELGAETVVDNEMLIDLGMVSFFIFADRSFHFKAYTQVGAQNISVGGKKKRRSRKAEISWTQTPRYLKIPPVHPPKKYN